MKAVGTKTIHTNRLILRKFTTEDAPDMFHNWSSDEENIRYLTWPAHTSIQQTNAIIAQWVDRYHDPFTFKWAIEYHGQIIGNISVVNINEAINACEVGYVLSKKYWGKGLMSEAFEAVIHYLFHEANFNRIAAKHDRNNPASGRVMKKVGMHYEGTLRQAGKNNQGICDEVCYSLLKEEWLGRQ